MVRSARAVGGDCVGAALTTSVIYCLYTYSPETEEMAQTFQVAHKGILEMLVRSTFALTDGLLRTHHAGEPSIV
jgi:hypothetical protein